jgi:hypothetical protein
LVGWSRPHRIRSDAGAMVFTPLSPRTRIASTNQSIKIKPINRSTNQINKINPIDQSAIVNQSINQSINRNDAGTCGAVSTTHQLAYRPKYCLRGVCVTQ